MPIINSDIRNNNLMIQIHAYFLVPILEIGCFFFMLATCIEFMCHVTTDQHSPVCFLGVGAAK
jgi:hypothetical protein